MREQLRHRLLSRYRAHGQLGALVPVDVEGVRGKRFVLDEELALLQAPPQPTPSVAFVAPFDSLLWTRPSSRACSTSTTCGRASSRRFVDAMRDGLRAYLRFAGADRLQWAPHLATEK